MIIFKLLGTSFSVEANICFRAADSDCCAPDTLLECMLEPSGDSDGDYDTTSIEESFYSSNFMF